MFIQRENMKRVKEVKFFGSIQLNQCVCIYKKKAKRGSKNVLLPPVVHFRVQILTWRVIDEISVWKKKQLSHVEREKKFQLPSFEIKDENLSTKGKFYSWFNFLFILKEIFFWSNKSWKLDMLVGSILSHI